jgi:ACS family hexuronate transporter-like MFS transporter
VDDRADYARFRHQLLDAQHAPVAAPTLMKELNIGTQQYSWIVGTFQGAIMLQPFCGYVLDVIGLKRSYALFAVAWSLISMMHGLAHN